MAKIKYPSVMPINDKKSIKRGKAVLKQMAPEDFLNEARPLSVGRHDKNIIHTFENDIESGHHLGPLKLYEDGKEDGRHRANAAKNLGVKKVPVVDYRSKGKKKKATGGPVLPLGDDDPNAAFRRLISWSFAVAPLFGRADGGAVNRHAYATDGGVTGDVSFASDDLPTFARQDPQEDIRTAVETAKSMPQAKKKYKPFGVLPLREDEAGVHFDPYAGVLGSVTRPAKYFYETMSGQKEMDPTSDEAIRNAVDLAGSMTLGSVAFERPSGAITSGVTNPLYHGSPKVGLTEIRPSERGPLGPGIYASEAPQVAGHYTHGEGQTYQLPHEDLDIYRGHGHRSDEEWFGYKDDQKRLINAVPDEFKDQIVPIIEKMWSGDGYPLYQRIRGILGSDEAAQNLFKKAGFQGISGLIDGPETLIFGPSSIPIKE